MLFRSTRSGKLPCQIVIHTVGPWYKDLPKVQADSLLRECVLNVLETAKALGLASVSLTAISTGRGGYPVKECAQVMVDAVVSFCTLHDTKALKLIKFNNFEKNIYQEFQAQMKQKVEESAKDNDEDA